MPDLNFKGKQFVYAHHLTVPHRTLEIDAKKSLLLKSTLVPGNNDGSEQALDGNLIIHGDNLHALKALMPRFAGRVNCIYIDPPYNTGNEGWCYNDNVNSPVMREWLKDAGPVDGEDLERHDKWLCMMWPRLHLLKELLAEDGVVFISIDDNEQHRLRIVMDEIFGAGNFVATVIWQKIFSPKNTAKHFSGDHDFILVYAKDLKRWFPNTLQRSEQAISRYKNPDNDPRGPWSSSDLTARNYYSLGTYEVTSPSGVKFKPSVGNYFRVSFEKFTELDRDGRILWGPDGNNMPRLKRYLSDVKKGVVPQTLWLHTDVGHTQDAKKELVSVLDFENSEDVFNTVKPTSLIKRILQIATNKDSIILDSFAGSGTTAHAVLALNEEDGGNRKFILVECEDYADDITAERVRRVINGYKFTGKQKTQLLQEKLTWSKLQKAQKLIDEVKEVEKLHGDKYDQIKKEVKDNKLIVIGEKNVTERTEGLGGTFTYCTLGKRIDVENLLAGENLPDYETLARYVAYTATGRSPSKIRKQRGKDGLFWETNNQLFYLIYESNLKFLQGNESALNLDRAARIAKQTKTKDKPALVFATHKFIGQDELTRMNITFCQLPYGIYHNP